jgi:4,5-DOPA dioxygenase extradiol
MDHGIWTVLRHMWPDASVPVLPLSLAPTWQPAEQWRLGQALAPLRDQGVLIIGSGSLTHNLRLFFGGAAGQGSAQADCQAFSAWVADRVLASDVQALLHYRSQAPAAVRMHPTDEHWLPFYVAAGAGSLPLENPTGVRVHASVDHGVLAMDAYAFGEHAADLLQWVQS